MSPTSLTLPESTATIPEHREQLARHRPAEPQVAAGGSVDVVPLDADTTGPVPDVVRAGVGMLAGVVAFGSACYLAPIEYQAGRWLGLPAWQAWTITAAVEGLTLAALLAGRLAGGLLPTALGLTWISAAVGTLHAAAEQATRTGRVLDTQTTTSALLVCVLMVLAPALMHRLRVRVNAEHAAALTVARQRAETAARELAERRAAERAAQREAAERDAERQRAHELALQRSRAFAEQEQTRLHLEHARAEQARADAERQAEQARAAAEQERAQAEQERAQAERDQAAAEQARADTARRRQQTEHQQAQAEQHRAALRADRDLARAHWADREATGTPMSIREVAELLDVSDSRARAIVADWRRRQPTPTPTVEGPQP
jgi:hypothetical protein